MPKTKRAILDLSEAGVASLAALLERLIWPSIVSPLYPRAAHPPGGLQLLAPVTAGSLGRRVTYLRSKKARMEESEFNASAYDRVYEADRAGALF